MARRMDEALAAIGKALELDPLSPTINAAAGRALTYAKQYKAAEEQLLKTIELDPQLSLAHFYLGQVYTLQGRFDEALAAFARTLEITGQFLWATCYIGMVYALMGDREMATDVLRQWERDGRTPSVCIASIYLTLGEDDKVFEWLERGYQEHDFLIPWVNAMPDYDRLRNDPRFENLMQRLFA
jgi:tetratricopeptide (TPR) repeat protein